MEKYNKIKPIRKRTFQYMGSKYKIMDWLFENLPSDIRDLKTLDVFGGGGSFTTSMCLTFPEADIFYNEKTEIVYGAYRMIVRDTLNMVHLLKTMNLLVETNYKKKDNFEMFEERKRNYYELREKYNNFGNGSMLEKMTLGLFLIKAGFGVVRVKDNGDWVGAAGDTWPTQKWLSTLPVIANKPTLTNKDYRDLDFEDYDFLYLDPPYWNSQGAYYEKDSLNTLLEMLSCYDGKFMMSYYPDPTVLELAEQKGWTVKYREDVKQVASSNKKTTEILVMNY